MNIAHFSGKEQGQPRFPPGLILAHKNLSFLKGFYNDHRMAKSIEDSIDFAAKRQVWQRMIL